MTILKQLQDMNGVQEYSPEIQHHFGSGVYARQGFIKKGSAVQKHSHTYSHLSILASGKVVLVSEKENKTFIAPACIEIPANEEHAIIAVEDSVWFCIHATEFADVDDLDSVRIGEVNV